MTKVFVHGNPETSAIWSLVVAELANRGISDVILLSPPGFGAPTPDGWDATQASYCAWLVGELEKIGGSIDLVGHDWGAGHVYGVIASRGELVRSWATDCGGLLHPDYVWHDNARVWQTQGAGEEAVGGFINMAATDKVAVLMSLGMTNEIAQDVASALTQDMARCILALYRSAAQPAMSVLGTQLGETQQPRGLVIIPTEDHFPGTTQMAAHTAAACGARAVELVGQGHWWMIADPVGAVDVLTEHWQS
ncbi:MAG: alpha/beta hydrolase [Ilumatobacteraceae bacterium]|nr:alpha/beta hydrolase [Ilumatobacteraceae bacterium]